MSRHTLIRSLTRSTVEELRGDIGNEQVRTDLPMLCGRHPVGAKREAECCRLAQVAYYRQLGEMQQAWRLLAGPARIPVL